jgi:drug/metabolite transporter (DMT)-like permease
VHSTMRGASLVTGECQLVLVCARRSLVVVNGFPFRVAISGALRIFSVLGNGDGLKATRRASCDSRRDGWRPSEVVGCAICLVWAFVHTSIEAGMLSVVQIAWPFVPPLIAAICVFRLALKGTYLLATGV